MNVNQKEYKIVKLLGHGKGGYSYLAEREGKFYVLKQIHHEPCEYYSFGNKIEAEQNDYNRLLQTGIRIPRMLDIDVANERILKEYIDYECNNYMDEWNFENWGIKYWSKTPEFIDYMEQRQLCNSRFCSIQISYNPQNLLILHEKKLYYRQYLLLESERRAEKDTRK